MAVDVVHMAYAFTRTRLERYFELMARSGLPMAESRICDDIFLSVSGATGQAVRLPLGPLILCESGAHNEIALHQQSDFGKVQNRAYTLLRTILDAEGKSHSAA